MGIPSSIVTCGPVYTSGNDPARYAVLRPHGELFGLPIEEAELKHWSHPRQLLGTVGLHISLANIARDMPVGEDRDFAIQIRTEAGPAMTVEFNYNTSTGTRRASRCRVRHFELYAVRTVPQHQALRGGTMAISNCWMRPRPVRIQ